MKWDDHQVPVHKVHTAVDSSIDTLLNAPNWRPPLVRQLSIVLCFNAFINCYNSSFSLPLTWVQCWIASWFRLSRAQCTVRWDNVSQALFVPLCVCVVCALISGSSDEVCLCVRAHIENEARLPNWPESIQSVSQWPKCWQRHTIWSFEATAEKNCSQWAVRLIVIDGIMLMPCSSSSAAVARMIWATLRTNRHHSREQIMKSKRKGDAAERCSANHHLFVWLFVCLKREKKWM